MAIGNTPEVKTTPAPAPKETRVAPTVAPGSTNPETAKERQATIEANAKIHAKEEAEAQARLEAVANGRDPNDIKKDPEAAKNAPPKKETFMSKLNAKLESASPETLRQLAEMLKMFGWNFAADYLNGKAEVVEIREKMTAKLKKENKTMSKTTKDGSHLKSLKTQHQSFVGAAQDGTPEKAMTFDAFVDRRIAAALKGNPGKSAFTIEDLTTAMTNEELQAEEKASDEKIKILDQEGFKESPAGTWTSEGKFKLGGDLAPGSNPVFASVSFVRNSIDKTWAWKINGIDKASGERLDAKAGPEDIHKQGRADLNKLANRIMGEPIAANATPATPVKPAAAPAPTSTPTAAPTSAPTTTTTPPTTPAPAPTATPTVTPPATTTPVAAETPPVKP